jgi:hypothetical protein
MAKNIAVVSYDTDPTSAGVADAIVFLDTLIGDGYSAELIHQWAFDETNAGTFKKAKFWDKFDGVVITSFYGFWNLRELILSRRPVICANSDYVDDLGLGQNPQEHLSENSFNVVNNAHPIIAGVGLPLGPVNVGDSVFMDSISTLNHNVDTLVATLANQAVLVTHQTHKLAYFGWYRMSQASKGSPLFGLLAQTAKWVFQ